MATNTSNNRSTVLIMVIAIIALLAIVAYAVMQTPDRRTTGERVGDAVSSLSEGVENAGEQLQDRTPAQKFGDAVEDAGDRVERATE